MSELITIARPYAKALFEIAQKKDSVSSFRIHARQLKLYAENEDFKNLLVNPKFSKTEKVDSFAKLIVDLPEEIISFLTVLAQENRLLVLPEIVDSFMVLCDQNQEIVHAELVSAKQVCPDFLNRLEANISKRYQAKVVIATKVDHTLLGGGILKVGDHVTDASLHTKLKKIAVKILD